MSGGSMEYLYSKVEEAVERLNQGGVYYGPYSDIDPLRRAFADHLLLVAKALHDIEWVDDADYEPGDERASIEAVLGANAKALELRKVIEDAEAVTAKLQSLIDKAKEGA